MKNTKNKLKKLGKMLFVLMFFLLITSCDCKENQIKVGQTWKVTIGKENPFRKPTIYYKRVIAIKGNYVKYVENNKDTLSDEKRWFLVLAELVENKH